MTISNGFSVTNGLMYRLLRLSQEGLEEVWETGMLLMCQLYQLYQSVFLL